MPQAAQPSVPDLDPNESSRQEGEPTRDPDSTTPKPSEPGALFRALVDAGAGAVVAYTADQQTHTMIHNIAAAQLEPLRAEMNQRFGEIDRRLEQTDRRLAALERNVGVLVAQMKLLLAGFGLLVTALIAVFGFLFTQ